MARRLRCAPLFVIRRPMKIACTVKLSQRLRQTVEASIPGVELLFPQIKFETGSPYFPTVIDPAVGDCEVLLGHINPRGLGEIAPRLRWIHLFSAGVDHVLRSNLVVERGIVLTNSSGTTAPWIAEYVIGAMLQHARGFNLAIRAQMRRQWFHHEVRAECHSLRGRALGIVGYGSIGRATATLAQAFGMEVLALKRDPSAHRDSGWSLPGMSDAEGTIPCRWFGPDDRIDLMRSSDYVLLAPPLTAATRHFIGRHELAAARPTAYLINVARGEVIDQEALVNALERGRLGGCCLDVTTPEPLTPESALWDAKNVNITFHTSAARPAESFYDLACELFAENLRRFVAGGDLFNVINPAVGY
jgi:phosphoglycerate dehydrogenase-like enzyme